MLALWAWHPDWSLNAMIHGSPNVYGAASTRFGTSPKWHPKKQYRKIGCRCEDSEHPPEENSDAVGQSPDQNPSFLSAPE
jgi:hypothetical protein